jgi:hypothetical protein
MRHKLHRRIDDRLQNKMQTRRGYLSERRQVKHTHGMGATRTRVSISGCFGGGELSACIKNKPRHLGVGKYSSEALVGVLRNHNGRLT